MFSRIDMSKLRMIGAGCNNVVITDGTYAIKLGNVSTEESNLMIEAHAYGLGVKVYDYGWGVLIPDEIISFLADHATIPIYEISLEESCIIARIMRTRHCNVLITDLAKPILKPGRKYSYSYKQKIDSRVNKLSKAYSATIGKEWWDAHAWNIAVYQNHDVIVDF